MLRFIKSLEPARRSNRLKTLVALGAVAVGGCGLVPSSASAGSHFDGCNVPSYGFLSVYSATRYANSLQDAENSWNALGSIRIFTLAAGYKATDSRAAFYDYDYPDGNDGITLCNGTTRAATYMNNRYLANGSNNKKRGGVTHEMGHVLGLGDHTGSQYASILMYSADNGVVSPQSHDISDYRSLWGPAAYNGPTKAAGLPSVCAAPSTTSSSTCPTGAAPVAAEPARPDLPSVPTVADSQTSAGTCVFYHDEVVYCPIPRD